MPDTLRDVLLDAWLSLVTSLELSDDDLVDPGFVSDALGDLVPALARLAPADRELLTDLIRQRAAAEPDPDRRQILQDTPGHFGLTE
ncbi:hypothetical protein [Actinoplanes sp. G11-F43]|uniref:hypothetical protein n=1 Tax=Actinoplanes sp. G11-F43 TaxID=3424130 RepID=UPI003D342D17